MQSFYIFTRKAFLVGNISLLNKQQNTEGELDLLYYFSAWLSLGISHFSH